MENNESRKFYTTEWFMWIMMLIFSPVGIYLLWKYCEKYSKNVKIIITVIFIIFFIYAINNDSQTPTNTKSSDVAVEQQQKVPTEYKNALKKAQMYSNTMHMSKKGIYNQLTSEYGESFSAEAAKYAVDNMQADWNENALKKAKQYSDTMSMSKNAIYKQLVSDYGEKFTESEAQYAVNNLYK